MRAIARLLAFIALALACAGPLLAAPVLSLVPSVAKVHPPESFRLDVVISGLERTDAASLLGAFDLTIYYDESRVVLTEFEFGGALGDTTSELQAIVGFEGGWVGTTGFLHLWEISLLEPALEGCLFCTGPFLQDLQSDRFVLASLSMMATSVSPGDWVTYFHLPAALVLLGDGNGEPIGEFSIQNGSLTLPEPAAWVLFVTGLLLSRAAAPARARRRCRETPRAPAPHAARAGAAPAAA